ncbi:truncated transcription factor CAULIFLOWER A-like isoform X2 [Nymphaea colorata]|uniref:truncated transcription factor CAULIFLOWER A-like isoform X2 n=1 Tax=Nymphaea colorata TaxID=210225 RepID=UPI00129ECF74|nr:truncated transcription factor CAULIFLOWER A-like isoform X2 [Nymphaea colorata]
MGRGKVQLKRIENKISRQVTFSKRRNGLLKKAQEISVLCDAEVALIVFSTKGKLYEYSSDSSMTRILERYERYSHTEGDPVVTDLDSQEGWPVEYKKLRSRFELLQKTQRQYMGEELEPLSIKELHQLELQLDSSLKRIRLRKTQLLLDSITELRKKAMSLQQQNEDLARKVQEKAATLDKLQAAGSEQVQRRAVAFLFNKLPSSLSNGRHAIRNGEAEEEMVEMAETVEEEEEDCPEQVHLQPQQKGDDLLMPPPPSPWTLQLI